SSKQSDEFFFAKIGGEDVRFNIHDYDSLYQHAWLYDIVLYKYLKCGTPSEIVSAMTEVWSSHDIDPSSIRMLEIGAGSGPFGQELKETVKVGHLVGLDISPHARTAALRDRPTIYDDYLVADLTALEAPDRDRLATAQLNCVGVASATGWGNHIPVAGFQSAFEMLPSGGWFIFHVKPNDPDPECIELCNWVETKAANGEMDQKYRRSHFHRNRSDGETIYYDVVIGRKT
ncbi:MAG: methyltransferase domain-containing protein, partial [Pseudomonadota bacterium]